MGYCWMVTPFRMIWDADGQEMVPDLETVEQSDAPDLPNSWHGRTNVHTIRYGQLDAWVGRVGLADLLAHDGDLLQDGHPGWVMLRPAHLLRVQQALRSAQARATLPAGYGEGHDSDLARLVWLEWWIRYGLATWKQPMFANY